MRKNFCGKFSANDWSGTERGANRGTNEPTLFSASDRSLDGMVDLRQPAFGRRGAERATTAATRPLCQEAPRREPPASRAEVPSVRPLRAHARMHACMHACDARMYACVLC